MNDRYVADNFICLKSNTLVKFCYFLAFFLVLFVEVDLHAQASATVLPQGFFRARVATAVVNPIQYQYDNSGNRAELASQLNRSVSAQELAANNLKLQSLLQLAQKVNPEAAQSILQADLYTKAEVKPMQFVPAVEYGLTSRLTIGLKVPIVRYRVQAGTSVDLQDNIQFFESETKNIAPAQEAWKSLRSSIPLIKAEVQKEFSKKFSKNGYEAPRSFSYTSLGDMELGAKYQFIKDKNFLSSAQLGFRLPTTTRTKRQAQVLDLGAGDGNFDIGFKVAQEWRPSSWITFSGAVNYEIQFPDSYDWSVRPNAGEGASAPLVPLSVPAFQTRLQRDLGDRFEGDVGLSFHMYRKVFTLSSMYFYTQKSQDYYSGSTQALNYASLSADSASRSHQIKLGAKFSTLPWVVAKEYKIPFEIDFGYFQTINARNATDSAYTRVDLIVFF